MKQIILIRIDLKMGKGKIAAQSAHACLEAALKFKRRNSVGFRTWTYGGAKKVALKVKSLRELKKYILKAKRRGLVTSLIRDAGHTQIKRGTITSGAIGPDREDIIDQLTGDLKLL